MAKGELVYIALAPPADLDEDLVKNAAVVLNKSTYDTRLLLRGKIPKVIARHESLLSAESLTQQLRDLGLDAITCRDSDLRRLPPAFMAQTLEFGEKEVLFQDSAGGEQRLAAGNVFLILVGGVEISVEEERTRSTVKFSLGRTLLMSGIPMWRRVEEKTTEQSTQDEYFARLYQRQSAEPAVDLFQHRLNYSSLGEKVAASSFRNFNTIVQRLRQLFPRAIFDDRLTTPSLLAASSGKTWEDIEINCKLIYLFHAAGNGA